VSAAQPPRSGDALRSGRWRFLISVNQNPTDDAFEDFGREENE
jgi:hypothetical protein